MTKKIVAGTRVHFQNESGTHSGQVLHVLPHIGNGQLYAVIEVDHFLPGMTFFVPFNEITDAE